MAETDAMMRSALGFLGGSFDPPHRGHLALAQAARTQLALTEVRLVPAAAPWQKGRITPAAQRADMVVLALDGEPGLVLDRTELDRGGASYTVDTLAALRATCGAATPLVWIIGGDQLARLDTWHDWRRLLDLGHLAVAQRNGAPHALNPTLRDFHAAHRAAAADALARPHGHVIDLTMPPVDVSATALRALLAEPAQRHTDAERTWLAQALKPQVLDYIRRHALYRRADAPADS